MSVYLTCHDFFESGYVHGDGTQSCCLHCGPGDEDDIGCELPCNLAPPNKNGVWSRVEGAVCCHFWDLTRDDVSRAVRYKRKQRDS